MKNLIKEDWEHEYQKMLVFLGEDEYLAKLEMSAEIIVKDDLNILENATKIRDVSLQRVTKEQYNS